MLKHAILLLVVAFLAASQTVQAAGYNCLKLDNPPDSAIVLNWQTGTTRKLSLPYADDSQDYAAMAFSLDARYTAYMHPDAPNADGTSNLGSLIIAPVNALGELGQGVTVRSGLPMPLQNAGGWSTITEFAWLQGSRWLLYRWENVNFDSSDTQASPQFVAIATPDGKTLRLVSLPSSITDVYLDTPSPDGEFMGLMVGNSEVDFLRIPDLTLVKAFSSNQELLIGMCFTPYNANPLCSNWAPHGHRVAMGETDPNGMPNLVVIDPEKPQPVAIFDIPNGYKIQNALWSPDDQHIALYSIQDSKTPARIDIFGLSDNSHLVVTNNAFVTEGGEGPNSVQLTWCDDYHLVYPQEMTTQDTPMAQWVNFSLLIKRALNFSPLYDPYQNPEMAAFTITPGCTSMYTLQLWSRGDTDYVGVENDSTQIRTSLIDHSVTGMKWIGTTALAWWHGGLAWMDADGSNRHEIDLDADVSPQDVSADGQWLLFTSAQNTPADLYIANLKTGAYRLLLNNATKWAFSPHDRYILATNGKSSGTYLVALPAGQSQAIDLGASAAGKTVNRLEWSPDGMIFAVFASDANTSTLDVFRFDGAPIRHFDNIPAFNSLSWSLACEK